MDLSRVKPSVWLPLMSFRHVYLLICIHVVVFELPWKESEVSLEYHTNKYRGFSTVLLIFSNIFFMSGNLRKGGRKLRVFYQFHSEWM